MIGLGIYIIGTHIIQVIMLLVCFLMMVLKMK